MPTCDNCFVEFPEEEWGCGWRAGHQRFCSGPCFEEKHKILAPDDQLTNPKDSQP